MDFTCRKRSIFTMVSLSRVPLYTIRKKVSQINVFKKKISKENIPIQNQYLGVYVPH